MVVLMLEYAPVLILDAFERTMPYVEEVLVADVLLPVIIQFFTITLSAPSVPVVLLDESLIAAFEVEVVATRIVKFLVPLVEGSSPSIVTLSAPCNSIIPLEAVGVAAELIVTFPDGLNVTDV